MKDNSNEKGIQLEKLTPDLTSLCNLVSSLPVPSAKHRLVRTEIAQKAAYILKNVIGLQVNKKVLFILYCRNNVCIFQFTVGQRFRRNCGSISPCSATTPSASCDAGLFSIRAE